MATWGKPWSEEDLKAYQKKQAGKAPEPASSADTHSGHGESGGRSHIQRSVAPSLNKTETEYQNILRARLRAGEFLAVLPHESVKVRVGLHRCWYTPDFAVIGLDGVLELHEVKGGHVQDDARVKFQAAARQYPCFRWVWAQKKKEGWQIA